MAENIPEFSPSEFSTDAYARHIDKPWGGELHWVPEDAPYMGKLLHIEAGKQLSLQIHDKKQESWLLIEGRAAVLWENKHGTLIQTELQKGVGYSTQVGQRHRLIGITDAKIIEVSTREEGTTWRLEDDYARPHETPEQRELERS